MTWQHLGLTRLDVNWKVWGVDVGTANGICGGEVPKKGVDACASREKALTVAHRLGPLRLFRV